MRYAALKKRIRNLYPRFEYLPYVFLTYPEELPENVGPDTNLIINTLRPVDDPIENYVPWKKEETQAWKDAILEKMQRIREGIRT